MIEVEEKEELEVRTGDEEGCLKEITQRRLHLTRLRKTIQVVSLYFRIIYFRKNFHAECWLKAIPELHTSERTALTTFDLSSMVNSEVIAQSLISR